MIAQNATAAASADEDADVEALQLGVAPDHRQVHVARDRVGDRVPERVLALQRPALLEQVAARPRSRSS